MSGAHGRTCARSASTQLRVGRVVLRHRDDHEIGDPGAVRVEVARRDRRPAATPTRRARAGRRRRAAAPRRSRRARRAPRRARLRPRRPRRRSTRRRLRRARRRSGGSPPSSPRRRPRSPGGPTRRGAPRATAGAATRRVGRDDDDLGLGRPAAPHRDDDVRRVAARRRAMCPVTAVLPDPLAGADHPERRDVHEGRRRRVEPEVWALVGKSEREHATREAQAARAGRARARPRGRGRGRADAARSRLDRRLERDAVSVRRHRGASPSLRRARRATTRSSISSSAARTTGG